MRSFILIVMLIPFSVSPLMADDSSAVADSVEQIATTTAAVDIADPGSGPEEVRYPMSTERAEALASYSSLTNIWRFVNFFIGLASMAIILFSGLSARLQRWVAPIKSKFLALWGFLALFIVVDYLITLPASIYRGYAVEVQYGFMNQTFWQWFGEDLLSLLLVVLFGVIPLWFMYWLIGRTKRWWLQFSIGAIPFLVLTIILVPIYIMPMFNDFQPLEDKALETKLLQLSERAGVSDPEIFQVNASKQSSKVNAYVTGLLASKRIVLNDTLLDAFTHDEILFVLGHEMGHYVMNHIWQGLGLAILSLLLTMWLVSRLVPPIISRFKQYFRFENIREVASLPLIIALVSIFNFFGQPVSNGFSRFMERKSDAYGMNMSQVSGEVAAVTFEKLSAYNLSDPDPHPLLEFWFYSHPAINKRIEFVKGDSR